MARLKFDRKINMEMHGNETVKVPEDEVWKVEYNISNGVNQGIGYMNNIQLDNGSNRDAVHHSVIGGGCTLRANKEAFITGIAFKIIN